MIEAFRLVFESILISILFIIPGFLFDSWLAKLGIVRADKKSIVISTIVLVLIKQIFYEALSWWWFGILLIFGIAVGLHREDFAETIRKGRWWWKSEKRKK